MMRPIAIRLLAIFFLAWTLLFPLFEGNSPLAAAQSAGQASPPSAFQFGADAMLNLYSLPQLGAYSQTYQVSSHDQTGGNLDAKYQLYQSDEGYVLFDDWGTGVITRIWVTTLAMNEEWGRFRFYFDNEPTPRIDLLGEDFFSGKTAPFLAPLVGNANASSGGYYNYIPITYSKRLKIVSTGPKPGYYDINYQHLAGQQPVSSFTGKEDFSRLIDTFKETGKDPKPANPGRKLLNSSATLAPGSETPMSDVIKGPAVISAIKMQLDTTDPQLLANLSIRIKWDGRDKAQVDAPLDYFFGSGRGEKPIDGFMAGINPKTHQYYFYFPMPFRTEARLSLVNNSKSPAKATWEIAVDPDTDGSLVNSNTGYFNAFFKSEKESPNGQDYNVVRINGRGRYVGTVMNFYSINAAIEGDERIYIDGNNTPQIYGTGFEDYFNGAFGFYLGPFSQPLHGAVEITNITNPELYLIMGAYRFLLADAVTFNSSLVIGFEHGRLGKNEAAPGQVYNSLAMWYGLEDSSLEQTDSFDVGNPASEQAHKYSNNGVEANEGLRSSYEGEKDKVIIEDSGYRLRGGSEFTVNINPNNAGVILRRRFDYNDLNQQANIYVDDQLVERWFSPGQNQFKRWRDEDFVIPPTYTQGKSSIRVRVSVVVEPAPWSEYAYTVFSLKPNVGFIPTPGQVGSALGLTVPQPASSPDAAFAQVWSRTDDPVLKGAAKRSWMWGDKPNGTALLLENYGGKQRLVQYHDKSRMEINNPNGNRNDQFFVTNGLLVREMISGQMQTGDTTFVSRTRANVPVAGDPGAGNPAPTYASFADIASLNNDKRAANRNGQSVTTALAKDGTTRELATTPAATKLVYYDNNLGHNIPDVFWNFMNSRGPVLVNGTYRDDVVVDWVYAMGFPLSEPYWTRAIVGGVEKDVLVQVFERRVLSYTPSNPQGFQVEMGNVGQHYYRWRYGN